MIECDGRSPVGCGMARVARSREGCGSVAGISGSSPVFHVAAVAGGWQSGVVVIGVALSTSQRGMRTGKWEHRRMVEG